MHSKFRLPGVMLLLYFVAALVQHSYSAPSDTITKNRFSFGANFVYNLSSDRKAESVILPHGTIGTNFSGSQFYYMKYRYTDAKSFNLNLSYHKKLTKKLSFSFGLGLSEKKECQQYLAYVDSTGSIPDPLYSIRDEYSVMVPLRMNYYFRRFIFSAGNNFNFSVSDRYTHTYDDHTEKNYKEKVGYYTFYMQESVSYRLLRSSHLYIMASAEQSERFYYNYGYNNWLMLGFNWYF